MGERQHQETEQDDEAADCSGPLTQRGHVEESEVAGKIERYHSPNPWFHPNHLEVGCYSQPVTLRCLFPLQSSLSSDPFSCYVDFHLDFGLLCWWSISDLYETLPSCF